MKKIKKFLSLSLAVFMTASLAACGDKTDTGKETQGAEGSQAESKGNETSEKSGGQVAVTIWDENQRAGLQQIMDDFSAATGIKADIQVVDWANYWTQLSAGASGGELPDVFWMHSNESQKYMSNGMLMDITERVKNSDKIDLKNYPEDITKLYQYEGKQFAMPKDIDTIALWYNKAIFDEAGVEYPKADWTWEDMYETAKKLTNPEKEVYGFSCTPDNTQAGYYNMIYSYGGNVISEDKKTSGLDDPKTLEAMQLFDKMIKETMPPLALITENKDDGLLLNGKVAMVMQGSWMLPLYKGNDYAVKNFDIQVLPTHNGKRVSIYNGISWTAAANTKVPEEAWKLIEWMATKEAQEKQAQLGVTMSAYKGTTDAYVKSFDKFNLKAYLDMMQDMVIRPYSRNTITWENNLIESITTVYNGENDMETIMKKVAGEMNDVLSKE